MSMWNIGGAILGGLLGGQSSTQSSTTTQTPYAPAQPFINQTINSGMGLQAQYAAKPLSDGQIGAYANSQGLTDNFRSQAGSLTSQMNNMRQFDRSNPTQRATQFNFTDAPANQQQTLQTVVNSLPQVSQIDLGRRIVEGGLLGNPSGGSSGSYRSTEDGGTPWGGIGTGNLTDSINQGAKDTFSKYAPFSVVGAGLAALYQKHQAQQEALAAANAAADPIGYLNGAQGWTGDGSSYNGHSGHYGSNYGNDSYSMGPSQTNTADTSGWGSSSSSDSGW